MLEDFVAVDAFVDAVDGLVVGVGGFAPLVAVAEGFALDPEGAPTTRFVAFAVGGGFPEALRLAATGGRVDLGAEDDDAAAPPSRSPSRLGGAGTGEEGSPNASKSRLASDETSTSPPR